MSCRLPLTCLILTTVTCGLFNFASADPPLPVPIIPHAPPGYLLVDEEMWSQLMDEAGRHLDRGREAFLHGHTRTTAIELRKAAIMMRIDAAHGKDRADLILLKSAHELEHLAQRLLSGQSTDSIDEIDAASSRALTALADHEQVKAALAWKQHHTRRSGYYLRAAADNLERAAFRARAELSTTTSVAIRKARVLSGKLVEGTGYAIDEVGTGIDGMGHQIERFGQAIMHPLTERR